MLTVGYLPRIVKNKIDNVLNFSHMARILLTDAFFSSSPAVSLCFGTDGGCGVLHVGGSQPTLHWDAHGPGKALWASLGVISE